MRGWFANFLDWKHCHMPPSKKYDHKHAYFEPAKNNIVKLYFYQLAVFLKKPSLFFAICQLQRSVAHWTHQKITSKNKIISISCSFLKLPDWTPPKITAGRLPSHPSFATPQLLGDLLRPVASCTELDGQQGLAVAAHVLRTEVLGGTMPWKMPWTCHGTQWRP